MKNYTLFERIKGLPDRQLIDVICENEYDAFNNLRKMFYGLRDNGIECHIGGTSAEPIANIIMPNKNIIQWVLVEQ